MPVPRVVTLGLLLLGAGLAASQLARNARDVSLDDWRDGVSGYSTALVDGREAGKPVAFLFYTEWCTACKELRRDVLTLQPVKRYLDAYVRVEVDLDAGAAAQDLAKRFGVVGIPALYVIAARSGVVRPVRTRTGLTPTEFIAACRGAAGA